PSTPSHDPPSDRAHSSSQSPQHFVLPIRPTSSSPLPPSTAGGSPSSPATTLPVPGVGRPLLQLELIRCRAGESADFEVEACDSKGRLALPSHLVDRSAQKDIGQRRASA